MFPFDLFEKALLDKNLSDKDKVLVSFLMKKISQSKTGEVEMYIGFLANEVMNCSDSSVKRALRSITEKGYIVKRNGRGKGNKKPVIIRLADEKSRSQVTPSCKSRGQNEPKVEVTGDLLKNSNKNNNSRQVSSQTSTGTCEKKSEKKMETEPNKERTYTSKENNAYVDKCLKRFDTMLKYLYSIKDRRIYDEYTNDILRFRESIDLTRFTEKQRGLIEKKSEAWAKIAQGKEHFFNGQSEKNDNSCEDEFISIEPEQIDCDGAEPISMDEQSTADRLTYPQSSKNEKRPSPAKTDWSKVGEWVVDSTIRFSNYELWHKELMRILNKKFGNGWENAEYKVMSQASAIYNTCCKTALEYYNSKKGTELTASDGDMVELAPWEESINSNKNFTPAEAVEHLKAKGAL